MRLIDANKLILHLNDYALQEAPTGYESTSERRTSEMVYAVINNCIKAVEEAPTAYDVDAVVEEIKKTATDDDGLIVSDGKEAMIWKSKAIKIVKAGGK